MAGTLYVKKADVFEVFQYTPGNIIPDIPLSPTYEEQTGDCEHCGNPLSQHGELYTDDGQTQLVCPGQYILRDVLTKRLFVLDADAFSAMFDPITNQ